MKTQTAKKSTSVYLTSRSIKAKLEFAKETSQCVTNWQEFPTVQKWFARLKKRNRNKTISDASMHTINFWAPRYFSFCNMTPDKLIEEALIDPDQEAGETRLSEFYTYQLNTIGRKRNFAYTGTWSVMRGFYSRNNVITNNWVAPKRQIAQTARDDDNYAMFEKNGKHWRIKTELLAPFMDFLSRRNKTIAVCLLQTGMDFADLNMITIGDITCQPDTERLFWRAVREKTHVPFVAVFGLESTELLRSYIKYERADAQSEDEPIFVADSVTRKEQYKIDHNMPKRTRLGPDVILPFVPVTVQGLAACFRRAAKDRLSLDVRKFSQHPFRAKRFRKIFRSACARVGLDDDLRRAFMGHTGSASMNYLEASKEELIELYQTIEPLLSVHKIIISNDD